MTDLSRIGAGMRALIAALALGMTIMSMTPGGTALAANMTAAEAVDDGAGDGTPGTDAGARKKPNPKPQETARRCAAKNAEGSIVLYLPGDTIKTSGFGTLKCGHDGKWHQVRIGAPMEDQAPSGGVFTPVP